MRGESVHVVRVELLRRGVTTTDDTQHRDQLLVICMVFDEPVRHERDRFVACLAFFSSRFCFKVFPDFLD